MDTTYRKRQRSGELSDLDLQRAGFPTKAELQEQRTDRKVQRILRLMERADMFAGGEFNTYEDVAGEGGGFTVAGNWNDETTQEFMGPIAYGWDHWYTWDVGPVPMGQPRYNSQPQRNVTLNDWPSRLGKLLETLGVNVVWSDEYLQCDCGKGFRTSPDCHSFEMYGWIGEGDYMCGDCYNETRCEDCSEPFAGNCNGYCHQWDDETSGPCCHCGCKEEE